MSKSEDNKKIMSDEEYKEMEAKIINGLKIGFGILFLYSIVRHVLMFIPGWVFFVVVFVPLILMFFLDL